MGHYNSPPDLLAEIRALQRRLSDLEQRSLIIKVFSNATRPPADAVPNMLIYNTSASAVQISRGGSWVNV